jgi:hypothetical protein
MCRRHLEEQAEAGKKLLQCISNDKAATLAKCTALYNENSASGAAIQNMATLTGRQAGALLLQLGDHSREDAGSSAAERDVGEHALSLDNGMACEPDSQDALHSDVGLCSEPEDVAAAMLTMCEAAAAGNAGFAAVPRLIASGVPQCEFFCNNCQLLCSSSCVPSPCFPAVSWLAQLFFGEKG